MDSNVGLRCYPAGLAKGMEHLIRQLFHVDVTDLHKLIQLQDSAEQLLVKLDG